VEAGFLKGNLSHPSRCISPVVMLGKARLTGPRALSLAPGQNGILSWQQCLTS
jgi:hypothetical protein